jgi:hypothetical protein
MQITPAEAERLGMELRRIVPTQAFQTSIEVLRHEFAQTIINTSPHEQDVREEAYRQVLALDSLIATFNTFISFAEEQPYDDQQ